MPAFLPPETSVLLVRVAERNARRARGVMRRLGPGTAWQRDALDALRATLTAMDELQRRDFLTHPGLRAWLSAAEEAVALSHPRRSKTELFDLVARGSHLAEVTPSGRIDRSFGRRVVTLAARLRERIFLRLPPFLMFLTPPGSRFGPFPLDLAPDGEEARAAGEIHLDIPFRATIVLPPRARVDLVDAGVRLARCPGRLVIRPAEMIPGSTIRLTRRVVSTRHGLRPGAMIPGLPHTLASALDLLGRAWPEARAEVLAHTSAVVPLAEKGTVSFSLPDRPGVSFINISGKTLVDLADDLLHETAHHRLHGLEELGPLVEDDGEPRYHSPWRKTLRPLRGILHAAYTFTYRAELLARLNRLPERLPHAWIQKELRFERESLARTLADLADAQRQRLLTPEGARVRRAIAEKVAALR